MRKPTTHYVHMTRDNAYMYGHKFLSTLLFDTKKLLDEGITRVRRKNTTGYAQWLPDQGYWQLRSQDWLAGFVLPYRQQVLINLMERGSRHFFGGGHLEDADRRLREEKGFNTEIVMHDGVAHYAVNMAVRKTSIVPGIDSTENIYTYELADPGLDEWWKQVVANSPLRSYRYAKDNVPVIHANLWAAPTVRNPHVNLKGEPTMRTQLMFTLPEHGLVDIPRSGVREFLFVHDRDMVPPYSAYRQVYAIGLAALERLKACKTEEEFLGLLNSNVSPRMREDTALKRYTDMRGILMSTQMGVQLPAAYESWRTQNAR